MGKLDSIEQKLLKEHEKDYPKFRQGDIVKVHYRVREKGRQRVHPLEGIVIKKQGSMHRKSFTIRRLAFGEFYEVTFPYYSPNIEKIEVVKLSRRKARRKKLYYLRNRIGKKAFLT